MKKLICNEVVRCQPYLAKKTLSHSLFQVFYLHFLRMSQNYFFEEDLKVCKYNLFQGKEVLLVTYVFNHDSSKSTLFMLNMAFDVLLSAVFVKYGNLELFLSCNIELFALCFDMYFLY